MENNCNFSPDDIEKRNRQSKRKEDGKVNKCPVNRPKKMNHWVIAGIQR